VLLLGAAVAATPAVYTRLVPIDLKEREEVVNGERHLTLTGWDRDYYWFLRQKGDVVVLQMGNPDVTDATLEYLAGMDRLCKLDLRNTGITDAGLRTLKELPAVESLVLSNTAVTDEGFREHLLGKESLKELNVRETKVRPETLRQWRDARPGRRPIPNPGR
jgi:hypothetical protein